MRFPLIELTGSPYERGVHHGQMLGDAIRRNVDLYRHRFARESGVEWAEVLHRARRFSSAIEGQNPDYFAGMAGVAAGSGIDLNTIAALNVRYEILYHALSERYSADGCTSLVVTPSRSADNSMILAQNWDWFPETDCAVVRTRDSDGHTTLTFTEAGIFGGKIGLNSAGLGLLINGLHSAEDDWAALERPFHVRCYEIMQQRSLDDAVDVVSREKRSCSANFIIGHRDGRVLNLESAPDEIRILHCTNGTLAHTNHFVDSSAMKTRIVERVGSFSGHRLACTVRSLDGDRDLTRHDIVTALADHTGFPNSVCQHVDPVDLPHERYETVASIMLDLSAETFHVASGQPCRNGFLALSLHG